MVLFLKRLLLEGNPLNYFINEFNKKRFSFKKNKNMNYRKLGKTNFNISEIALGRLIDFRAIWTNKNQ